MLCNMFEQCLYFNSSALARTVNRIWTKAYSQFDLSPPHAFLLRLVLVKPGLLPHELATELHLSRSTVTRFLDNLEKRNFLKRKRTGNDGREVQIFPTEKSKKIHKKLDKTGSELTQLMAKVLGEEDLSRTVSKLRKIQSTIDKI